MLALRRNHALTAQMRRHNAPVFRILRLSTRTDAQISSTLSHVSAASVAVPLSLKERLTIYSQLSKARLSALVVLTAGSGFFMMGGPISWSAFAALSVGTTLAAASANTFNQAWEIKTDSMMKRTMTRPLPRGAITRNHAVAFGAATAVTSTALLAAACNPLTASLSLFNIGLYSLVYTPMKQTSEWNTWVGALVGAIPPVMGVTAANGMLLSPEAMLTGAALFMWQMPHFFALSWRLRHDYARGGYKMIPCADPTGVRTSGVIMRYALGLTALPVAAAASGATSYMFALEGLAINAYAVNLARKFYAAPSTANAQKVFLCSLWYLPAVLGLMVFHSKNWDEETAEAKQLQHEPLLQLVEGSSETNQTATVAVDAWTRRVNEVKSYLKEVCVHEYLWKPTNSTAVKSDDSHLFCPIVVTESALDTVHTTRALTKDMSQPTH
ncbi:protoheme IX farnesyltransferase [Aphanomyces invadans]|nr:protoheme IX farnesyltransferase [Aphanomyces invadans]ETV97791.1 protoheme IX farnesyltransferase [Aphanomyces invadans]|eukprot:XP_008873352.1 protoheme IX farnesyltransferase [Aphanomyces invadans]